MKNKILSMIGIAMLFTAMASTSESLIGSMIIGCMAIFGALILLYVSRKGGFDEKTNRNVHDDSNRLYFLH